METNGLYEFGEYRLDAAERLLLRRDQPISLTPKAFEILLVLVQHSGHLVSKDQLLKEVWNDAFVEEVNVARNVWTLRKALGDEEREHRYIETVPKIGYRFVAPVRQLDQSAIVENEPGIDHLRVDAVNGIYQSVHAETRVQMPAPVVEENRGFRLGSKLPVLIVVTAVIAVAIYVFTVRHAPAASEPPIKSLAILPFKSLTGESDDRALGITDTVIAKVSETGNLTVRQIDAVRKYADQQTDSLKAAKELNVDAVVDGTIQTVGDQLRITVNLRRTQDGKSLLAEPFDFQVREPFKLQDEIARRVATQLRIKLRETNSPTMPPNPEAYDYYLKAGPHLATQNLEQNNAAIELLEKSVRIDPNFAPAHAALARGYRNKGFTLRPDQREWAEKASAEIAKALALNPDLAEARLSKCSLLWTPAKGFPHTLAIEECRRAVELNPNLDEGHHQLSVIYNHIGLLDKAQEEIQKAVEINPNNTGARLRVGINLTYQCKYDEALTAFGSEPNNFSVQHWASQLSYVLFELGKKEQAAAMIEKYLKELPQDEGGRLTSMKALLAASDGNTEEALANIKRAEEIGKTDGHFHHTAYMIALTYALLNKRTEAVEWLRRTADGGFPCYPLFEHDPLLQNLREDRGFQAFMKTMKEQWERYNKTL